MLLYPHNVTLIKIRYIFPSNHNFKNYKILYLCIWALLVSPDFFYSDDL
jgi:hypothetical protein